MRKNLIGNCPSEKQSASKCPQTSGSMTVVCVLKDGHELEIFDAIHRFPPNLNLRLRGCHGWRLRGVEGTLWYIWISHSNFMCGDKASKEGMLKTF